MKLGSRKRGLACKHPRAGNFAPKHGSYDVKTIVELAFGVANEDGVAGGVQRNDRQSSECGVHPKTGRRARSLVVNALAHNTEQAITRAVTISQLPRDDATFHAQKLAWDETALRFHCSEDVMKTLLPDLHFEPRLVQVPAKKKRRVGNPILPVANPGDGAGAAVGDGAGATVKGREVVVRAKPTYVVQVMQAGGQIKCGDATGEYIARPTLIESTSTEHIYHGVEPWLRSDALSSAAQPQDETFCGLYGDSLAANKLVVTQAAEQHPDMPLHDGFCVGHQLSICSDEQMRGLGDVINPVHATKKLMQQAQPRQSLRNAYAKLASKAQILRGVAPPEEFEAQHREIVSASLTQDQGDWSLFSLRHPDKKELGLKEQGMVDEMLKYHNGDWSSLTWVHYCCRSKTDRRPCCISVEQARSRLLDSMQAVSNEVVWNKLAEGTKKWCESPRRCSKLALLTAVHSTFPQAVERAWGGLKRGREEESSEEHVTDAYEVKKQKRKGKAVKFWKEQKKGTLLCAIGVATRPIRRLLSKHFAAEKEARVRASLGDPNTSPSLMGQFSRQGGHLDQAIEQLESLLNDDSPLLRKHCSGSENMLNVNRGMVLRGLGALKYRLVRRLQRKTSIFACIDAIDGGNDASQDFTQALMQSKVCCLEAFWERRVRRKWEKSAKSEPPIQPGSQMKPGECFSKQMAWVANKPPLYMISAMETNHADMANKLRGSAWWKQGLLPLVHDQVLERWMVCLPRRVALRDGLEQPNGPQHKKTRHHNQYSADKTAMLPESISLVTKAMQEEPRVRRVDKGRSAGNYVAFRATELRKAKSLEPGSWDWNRLCEFEEALQQK